MAISQVPPLSSNVPIVYPPGHPSAGCPTPAFATLMQILLDEKAITDALAQGAIQPGTVTTSGLTAAAQRILGNKEATTGAIEELTLSQVLDLIGSAAQGDLLFRGSAGWQRLAAGTSGQFLKTLGTGADPAWASAPAGGSGAMTLISEQTPSGTGTVTFSSIPATYRDLRLVIRGRGTTLATVVAASLVINSDTGSNYDAQRVSGVSATASAAQFAAVTNLYGTAVGITGGSATSGIASAIETIIYGYRGTTFEKAAITQMAEKLGTGASDKVMTVVSGHWRNTAAITQLDVVLASGNFVAGSVVSLYGIV